MIKTCARVAASQYVHTHPSPRPIQRVPKRIDGLTHRARSNSENSCLTKAEEARHVETLLLILVHSAREASLALVHVHDQISDAGMDALQCRAMRGTGSHHGSVGPGLPDWLIWDGHVADRIAKASRQTKEPHAVPMVCSHLINPVSQHCITSPGELCLDSRQDTYVLRGPIQSLRFDDTARKTQFHN